MTTAQSAQLGSAGPVCTPLPASTSHGFPCHTTQQDLSMRSTLPHPTKTISTPKRPMGLKIPPSPITNQSPTSPTDGGTHSLPSSLTPRRPQESQIPPSDNRAGPASAGLPRHLHVPAAQHRAAALPHPPATAQPGSPLYTCTPGDAPARPSPDTDHAAPSPHLPSSPWAPSWPGGSRKGLPAPHRTGL